MFVTNAKSFAGAAGLLAALGLFLSAAAAPPRQSAQVTAIRVAAIEEASPAAGSAISLTLDAAQSKVH